MTSGEKYAIEQTRLVLRRLDSMNNEDINKDFKKSNTPSDLFRDAVPVAGPEDIDSPFHRTATAPTMGTAGDRSSMDTMVDGPAVAQSKSYGRYVIEGERARGGLGRVLQARDTELDRTVAIKELIRPRPTAIARFWREAMITARLQHPSIVPVYDAGQCSNNEPYYAMKLVSGRSFRELIENNTKEFEDRLAMLPNVIAVADAIAYAHSLGIIHRDIKPSNILIGQFGETVVVDWGLAKDLNTAEEQEPRPRVDPERSTTLELTLSGAVMGTPAYMSPEQATGETVDRRTDVYALGALLYHLLAGDAPYPLDAEVTVGVLAGPPKPLEQRQPSVPKDLLAIVHTAMARNPADRYPSAQAVAEDLRRFQTGQLVNARQYSLSHRLVRWLRRRWFGLSLGTLALLMTLAFARSAMRELDQKRQEQVLKESAILLKARGALERDPTEALAWLKTYPEEGSDWASARDIALEVQRRGVARHVFHRPVNRVCLGAFSPNSRFYVGAGHDNALELWDLAQGRVVLRHSEPGELYMARFSPDATWIAFTAANRDVLHLWEPDRNRTLHLTGHSGNVVGVVFSPDSRYVVPLTYGRTLRMWSLDRRQSRDFDRHSVDSSAVEFSPDSRLMAFAGEDHQVHVVDLANDSRHILRAPRSELTVFSLTFTSDGKQLMVVAADGWVDVWDRRSWKLIDTFREQPQGISAVALSPDGTSLASAGTDETVRLRDLRTRTSRVLQWPGELVNALAFSRDGMRLAAGGLGGTVRLWQLDQKENVVLRGHRTGVYGIAFSPDGHFLASNAEDTTTRIWEVAPLGVRTLVGHHDDVLALAFSQSTNPSLLASASSDTTIRLWNPSDGSSRVLRGHQGFVWRLAFSPDGQTLASASWDHAVRLWETDTGQSRVVHRYAGTPARLAFSSDGELLASSDENGVIYIERVRQASGYELAPATRKAVALAFIPGQPVLAAGQADGRLVLWDIPSGRATPLAEHTGPINELVASPDGKALAAFGADQTVRSWTLPGGKEQILGRTGGPIRVIQFSTDGRMLAAGSEDRIVYLWDLQSGKMQRLVGHEVGVDGLAFAPGRPLLASASWDGFIRLWDVRTGMPERFLQHGASIRKVVFSPTGEWLATAGTDKLIRLWPLDPVRQTSLTQGRSTLHDRLSALSTAEAQPQGLPATP